MWLVKCLKSFVSEHLVIVNTLNSLKNCTANLPSYRYIPLAKAELEKDGLSVFEILGLFVITLTPDDTYYPPNRKNLQHSVLLQLSKI